MTRPASRGHASQNIRVNVFGFHYTYRNGYFDWRTLHGIDVEAVIRLTDVRAIEDCLETLQRGNLSSEKGLSVKNCTQLFRLLQLSIEYLSHLRNAHAQLIARYEEAANKADRWRYTAQAYLDAGHTFLGECMQMGAMSRQRLDQVDQARVDLDVLEGLYNRALDELEVEDQRARYFHFRKQRAELNWQQVHAVDLEEMVNNDDTETLDLVLHNITFGSIVVEDREELTPHHFAQLVPLAQCALDFALFQANATGALLEQAMSQLQSACMEIPSLTTATKELHESVTSLIMDAHSLQQQHKPGGAEAAGGAATPRGPRTAVGARPGTASATMMPPRPVTPASLSRSTAPASLFSALGGGGAMGRPSSPFEDPLLLVAAAGPAGLIPALEMQGRTAELHYQVDNLEQDLRMERYKTDEMRRILSDIKDRLGAQLMEPPGGQSVPDSPPTNHGNSWGSLSGLPPGLVSSSLQAAGTQAGRGLAPGSESMLPSPFQSTSAAAHLNPAAAGSSPQRVRIIIDEDAIRREERQRTMTILSAQIEAKKQQTLDLVSRRQRLQPGGLAGMARGGGRVGASAARSRPGSDDIPAKFRQSPPGSFSEIGSVGKARTRRVTGAMSKASGLAGPGPAHRRSASSGNVAREEIGTDNALLTSADFMANLPAPPSYRGALQMASNSVPLSGTAAPFREDLGIAASVPAGAGRPPLPRSGNIAPQQQLRHPSPARSNRISEEQGY